MAALTTQYVDTRVGRIQLQRGGAGEPLAYLHSATGEGPGIPFLAELADHFDVMAPMFPGFAESEGIEQIDDMEDATFHLLDLWDALGLTAPTVVGLSLGGWMAAELATRYPERVGRLVLVNPVGHYLPGAPIKDIFGRSPGEMADDLFFDQSHPIAQMMHAFGDMRHDPAQLNGLTFEMIKPVVQTMAATARLGWDPYLHNPKLRGRLHRVTAPTLVVRGAQDTLVPAEHAQVYVDGIAGAQFVEIPDSAHLVPLERPSELVSAIVAFGEERMSHTRSRGCVTSMAGAVLVLSLAACGATAKSASSSTPGTGVVTTAAAAATTTSSPTTGAPVMTSTTAAISLGTRGTTACELLTAKDFTGAEVPATSQAGTDVSSNFNIAANLTSTACEYSITGTAAATRTDTIGVTLIVATGATAADFTSAAAGLGSAAATVPGLGTAAVYVEMPSSDDPGTTANTLLVRFGSTLVELQGLDVRILDKAHMLALAYAVMTRL